MLEKFPIAVMAHVKSIAALDTALLEVEASLPAVKAIINQEMLQIAPHVTRAQEALIANGALIGGVVLTMPVLFLIDRSIIWRVYLPIYRKLEKELGSLRRKEE